MRYVIVAAVHGEAGEFNDRLRREVWHELGAKSSKLPAHFTIKAPFEYEGAITELERILEQFSQQHHAYPYRIEGYDHFDDRVVFMDVKMSKQAKETHDELVECIAKIPYIRFQAHDGKNKRFHVTISSKRIQPIYDQLWAYVQQYPCDFACLFDHISIYRWEENT